MRGRLLLVRDGLAGAAPWIGQLLKAADLNVITVSRAELAHQTPADAVLLSIRDRDPVATCWSLHGRAIVRWLPCPRQRVARSASAC